MPRFSLVPLALLALTTAAAAPSVAQSPAPPPPPPGSFTQSQPAPIERAPGPYAADQRPYHRPARIQSTEPAPGVFLRVSPGGHVSTVSSGTAAIELRVDHGLANVDVHHAAHDAQILVDLPGGQTSLLKDGLYTFNADSNTVRVLQGEAAAFPPGAPAKAKPLKVKEDHAVAFGASPLRTVEFGPAEASADLLPRGGRGPGEGGFAPYGYGPYGYGPYGDGFYPGPYGYPYGWDYPYWGYGYPFGFGFGFGYYGGFGGFRRGWRR